MINEGVLSRFEPLGRGLLKPIYADYSFGNIPNTIEYLLTGERRGPILPPDCFGGTYPRPQKVVLFFIDAFGWNAWQRYGHRFRATSNVMKNGVLTPISALFPSTTAASVATMHFGVLPSEHAFYEWNIYVPAYGEVIKSLPFSPLGVNASEGCVARGFDPAALTPIRETVHERLGRHGVRSLQFAHASWSDGSFNNMLRKGAEIIRHYTWAEVLVQLREAVQRTEGKAWFQVYSGAIDATGHVYGPDSPYHAAEVASTWLAFDDVLTGLDSPDTLFLFTADHGAMGGAAAETFNLNERIPELPGCLAISPTGKMIYPSGSPRNVFLHVKPERLRDAFDLLHRHLDETAVILPVDEAVALGLFGRSPVGAELRARLGDILILPLAGKFVWWNEPGVMQNNLNGHHGGLTPEELYTVVGAIDRL